ncbi:hypothetical protein FRC18_001017 [Serendipita sp. 400]|nr:hypothetical protein FRC18_001017 [Serendipita sp. 400]
MLGGSNRLPIELWEEIFSHVLYRRLFPSTNATIFDEMDLFSHPCKVYAIYTHRITMLRLVCRLWNEIIGIESKVLFGDGRRGDSLNFHRILPSSRVDLIKQWNDYCRKWPCVPRRDAWKTRQGRCVPAGLVLYSSEDTENDWMHGLENLANLRVLRLFHDVRGPIQILDKCTNLEALWIYFTALWQLMKKQPLSVIQRLQYLSYLHLDTVTDIGSTYTLHLPTLTYIEMRLYLETTFGFVQSIFSFPLDLHTPIITTIVLSGVVSKEYISHVEKYINSCRSSVVHLLLSYTGDDSASFLPPHQLSHFPQLSTLGLRIDSVVSLSIHELAVANPPKSSPFSLVLFGLDARPRRDNLEICRQHLREIIGVRQKWFSKVLIPMEWAELRNTWVQYRHDTLKEDGHLPCYWSVLNDLDQSGIPIQDRNGVGLREGDGRDLIRRMRCSSKNGTSTADCEAVSA